MINAWIDAVSEAATRITWRPDACVRNNKVVAARVECRACAVVCPAAAIRLDPFEVSAPPCNGCQVCLPACPAAALAERAPIRRELVEAWQRVAAGSPCQITCGLTESPDGAPALQTHCLAALRWEALVVPLACGATVVQARHGDCSSCRLGAGAIPTIQATVDFAAKFARAFGLGRIEQVGSEATPRNGNGGEAARHDPLGSRKLSRRDIFSRVFRRGQDTAGALGETLISELARRLEWKSADPPSDDGLWVRKLLVAFVRSKVPSAPVIPKGPLTGRPELDETRCTRCGVCVAACPTGALSAARNERNDNGLYLASARCTECGACARACREDAIRFSETVDLSEWGTDSIELAPPMEATCRVCGQPALDPVLPLCSGCYREGAGAPRQTLDGDAGRSWEPGRSW